MKRSQQWSEEEKAKRTSTGVKCNLSRFAAAIGQSATSNLKTSDLALFRLQGDSAQMSKAVHFAPGSQPRPGGPAHSQEPAGSIGISQREPMASIRNADTRSRGLVLILLVVVLLAGLPI